MSSACTSKIIMKYAIEVFCSTLLLSCLHTKRFASAIKVSHKKCLSLDSACPVHYTSSEVHYFKRSTMYFVLKYPLKCSEVCFEVQRSAYFAVLRLHCRQTWVCMLYAYRSTCNSQGNAYMHEQVTK